MASSLVDVSPAGELFAATDRPPVPVMADAVVEGLSRAERSVWRWPKSLEWRAYRDGVGQASAMTTSRSKYRNVRCDVRGETFDSKAEARRWQELQLLERAGKIDALQRQVRFSLRAYTECFDASDVVGKYVADFDYWDLERDCRVTEDVKGMVTPLAKWKMKHFAAQYGREVQIVRMR